MYWLEVNAFHNHREYVSSYPGTLVWKSWQIWCKSGNIWFRLSLWIKSLIQSVKLSVLFEKLSGGAESSTWIAESDWKFSLIKVHARMDKNALNCWNNLKVSGTIWHDKPILGLTWKFDSSKWFSESPFNQSFKSKLHRSPVKAMPSGNFMF